MISRLTISRIEFGGECYCGNSIVTASGAQQIDCSLPDEMTCGGNIFEYCGGRGFMNLWYLANLGGGRN